MVAPTTIPHFRRIPDPLHHHLDPTTYYAFDYNIIQIQLNA
jgi:hypothetical protein